MTDSPHHELIDRVELLGTGELLVGLASEGTAEYEHVYRAAAGVSWDAPMRGFRSSPIRQWSVPQWYAYVVSIVREELGVELGLGDPVSWRNISERDRQDIEQTAAR
jgi:hypothetical protein